MAPVDGRVEPVQTAASPRAPQHTADHHRLPLIQSLRMILIPKRSPHAQSIHYFVMDMTFC